MSAYVSLSSLSMDLKRVALGYHRNSLNTAERFYLEAVRRNNEIDRNELPHYLEPFLKEVNLISHLDGSEVKAEKALLLSVLFQNAAIILSGKQSGSNQK